VAIAGCAWALSAAVAQTDTAEATPAAPAHRAPEGILEIVFSGGAVGITLMLILIGMSLLAAYLICEQAFLLRRRELIPAGLGDQVREAVQAGRMAEADRVCRGQPCFLSYVLQTGLAEIEGGWPAVEKAMEEALAEHSARLFRRVEYLSVLGNIAPMVGLLGTVTGMILAFYRVAETQGTAGAAELAEGIYEALVTTVAGLVIAIPALGAFAVFRNRVDELVAEAAYAAQHALGVLKRRRAHRPPPVTPPPPPPGEGGR
jgi:biopolymer transport protein ExbB